MPQARRTIRQRLGLPEEPWEVDAVNFHKNFPEMAASIRATQPSSAYKLGKAVGSGIRLSKTVAAETSSLLRTQSNEAVTGAKLAAEKLRRQRHHVGMNLPGVVGRSLLGNVTVPSPTVSQQIETTKQSTERRGAGNPLSRLLEKAKGYRPSRRAAGWALAATLITGAVTSEASENIGFNGAVPAVASSDNLATPHRPQTRAEAGSQATSWGAPRARDRVIYNALPLPSAKSASQPASEAVVDYERIDSASHSSAAEMARPTDIYRGASRAEMDEILRIAEAARVQAELQQYQTERTQRVGELLPGQQVATLRLVQTGENALVGAPTGTRVIEHPVMVGMYDPTLLNGQRPTALDIDQGANDTLDYGAVAQVYGGSVPGIDVDSPYNTSPVVITLHHLTPLTPAFGTASTDPTQGLRWPEKTTIADPDSEVLGDMLTLTVGDELQIYRAIDHQIVDTQAPDHAEETRLIYGTDVYDQDILRLVTCYQSAEEMSQAGAGDIPAANDRYVTYFELVNTVDQSVLEHLVTL